MFHRNTPSGIACFLKQAQEEEEQQKLGQKQQKS
jgi:hypothetical protein